MYDVRCMMMYDVWCMVMYDVIWYMFKDDRVVGNYIEV